MACQAKREAQIDKRHVWAEGHGIVCTAENSKFLREQQHVQHCTASEFLLLQCLGDVQSVPVALMLAYTLSAINAQHSLCSLRL